jgi:hypothetical protein
MNKYCWEKCVNYFRLRLETACIYITVLSQKDRTFCNTTDFESAVVDSDWIGFSFGGTGILKIRKIKKQNASVLCNQLPTGYMHGVE